MAFFCAPYSSLRHPRLHAGALLALLLCSGCGRPSQGELQDVDGEPEPSGRRDAGKGEIAVDGGAVRGDPQHGDDDSDGSGDDAPGPATPSRADAATPRVDAGTKLDASAPVGADASHPGETSAGTDPPLTGSCKVGPVPDELRQARKLDPFYKKHADANGVPILASDKPVDRTLELACMLVNEMLSERPDARDGLIKSKAHFTIIGAAEKTTDTPEYSNLPDYYNTRARGLGGLVGSCAEESILCDRAKDRWYGESICVHEFSHTISLYGLAVADKTFTGRLDAAFKSSKEKGLFTNTYAAEQPQEYWAEGVQNWYNTNLESRTPNGVHGPINTKDELEAHDPTLYALVDELLPAVVEWPDCYRKD